LSILWTFGEEEELWRPSLFRFLHPLFTSTPHSPQFVFLFSCEALSFTPIQKLEKIEEVSL
jgi:hypothetical protein